MNHIDQFRVANRRATSLKGYCNQVVDMISDYAINPKTLGEMLVPNVDAMVESYRRGDGVILVNRRGRVVANSTLWELVNRPEIGVRLYELGGWIVDSKERHKRINGLTIGEYVAMLSLDQKSREGGGVIATVKKQNSLRGLERVGAKAISYADFPYIAGGTCVCPLSSEYRTGTTCNYRRSIGNGERLNGRGHIIDNDFYSDDHVRLSIPCTLMGFDVPRLRRINDRLAQSDRGCNNIPLNNIRQLGVGEFSKLHRFYSTIGISL